MTDPQPSGDYGYDLVHEEIRRARGQDDHPPGPSAGDPSGPASPAAAEDDRTTDFGYDEAHDF